ncbi:MAG: hypothetical protein ACI8QZ_002827 [Chlamydiales bacterium]|jgi:hypothetical protein
MSSPDLPTETFWRQLSEAGTLDNSLVDEYRHVVNERPWKPIGRIMIEEGHVTMRQMSRILGMKVDEPDLRVGDLAVRENFCTHTQVEECLAIQSEQAPRPTERIQNESEMDDEQRYDALIGYISFLERRNRWLVNQ